MEMYLKYLWIILLFPLVLGAELIPIELEHAITPQQKMRGLMERTELGENAGMLFHYEQPKYISIWMMNTKIDLSLAYLDDKGVIKEIHELKAYPEVKDPTFFANRMVTSSFRASYALEMRAHWFSDHQVNPGAHLIFKKRSSQAFIETK